MREVSIMVRHGLRETVKVALLWSSLAISNAVLAEAPAAAPGPVSAADAATSLSAPSPAAVAPPAGLGPTELAVEKLILPNGLEVILHEDKRAPQVTVNVWYHVGAFNEQPGKTGFAHLFEHLMFQGSAHVPPEKHFKFLEEAGASFVNGSTDYDRTDYYQTVPRHEVELALWLEADRMGWLMESMGQPVLDEQRGVVKNERRQTTEASPYGLAREKLWQAVVPPSHPYHGMVIGSLADLDRASLDDVRRFYDDSYAPANATLCIVGDFDTADMKKLVDKYFRSLPAWKRPDRRAVAPPTMTADVQVLFEEPVATLAYVEMLWLVPGRGQPGELDLEVLAHVLGDGIASKLQDALLVQTEQAESVSVEMESLANFGAFHIGVVVRPGVAAVDVLETIQSQLDYLQEIPVQPEEVARTKKLLETEFVFSLESGSGRANVLQEHNHYEGDPGAWRQRMAALRAVTDESVMAAMKTWLPKDHRGVLIATPAMPKASTSAEAPKGPPPAEEQQ
jgi:predicted Zn-dependent peptidase